MTSYCAVLTLPDDRREMSQRGLHGEAKPGDRRRPARPREPAPDLLTMPLEDHRAPATSVHPLANLTPFPFN